MDTDSEDMEQNKQMVIDMCICPQCPSWVECGEKGGYCLDSIGKSGCITEEQGCICGGCPVTEKFDLKHSYYCTRGSEKELLKKE